MISQNVLWITGYTHVVKFDGEIWFHANTLFVTLWIKQVQSVYIKNKSKMALNTSKFEPPLIYIWNML